MELDIISYADLSNPNISNKIKSALFKHGIIGVRGVPRFEELTNAYIKAAREFSALSETIKEQYAPERDSGHTEGYELGAERFKDENGEWQIDTKKASFYAHIPDQAKNKWPREADLQTHYLALANLIFETGKEVLHAIGVDETIGIKHEDLTGYARMLHYHKEHDSSDKNPNWCGAHLDHGVFTGLAPAFYFKDGQPIDEPQEAGLYVKPSSREDFMKVNSADKTVLFFQTGEFGQLASNDAIRATEHVVKKAHANVERFTLAVFLDASDHVSVRSTSELTQDARYQANKDAQGAINYKQWATATFEQYRANS